MESDTVGLHWEDPYTNKKTLLEVPMALKRFKSSASGSQTHLNLLVCGLCLISLSASGYFSYRETLLETRLNALEVQLASVQQHNGVVAHLADDGEQLYERLRREVQTRLASNGRRLLMAATSARSRRDASECSCPQGKCNALSRPLLVIQLAHDDDAHARQKKPQVKSTHSPWLDDWNYPTTHPFQLSE